jgi:glycosyltransferase involved in cell wall biosynthesis
VAFKTIVIIPASNEADRLAETIEHLPENSHVLVVDDGSRDATAATASDSGAQILFTGKPGRPAGKGYALLVGLKEAINREPEAILLADADLGASAGKLGELLETLEDGSHFAVAAFPQLSGGGFGLVKNYARREIFRRTGFESIEPLSGQRALLTPALQALPGIAPGFGAEVGMTLDLLKAGFEPVEIPLSMSHRKTGRSLAGFAHRARQGHDILKALKGERIPWQ